MRSQSSTLPAQSPRLDGLGHLGDHIAIVGEKKQGLSGDRMGLLQLAQRPSATCHPQ